VLSRANAHHRWRRQIARRIGALLASTLLANNISSAAPAAGGRHCYHLCSAFAGCVASAPSAASLSPIRGGARAKKGGKKKKKNIAKRTKNSISATTLPRHH